MIFSIQKCSKKDIFVHNNHIFKQILNTDYTLKLILSKFKKNCEKVSIEINCKNLLNIVT